MNLYFVRHGESEANTLRVFSNRQAKHGLTSKGKDQVNHLADKLKGMNFDAMFTSPLLRAIESSEILGERLDIQYIVSEELREFDVGVLEGKSDDEGWIDYENLLHNWLMCGKWDMRIEGGDSYYDIADRFLPFMCNIRQQYSEESNFLVVGHGGVYRCMFPLILANVDFEQAYSMNFSNTGYALVSTANSYYYLKEGPR